jgi:trk system potassium uptake protein TrkH
MKKKEKRKISTTRWIATGFLIVILLGTFLLMLPNSSASGKSTGFIDALFTATTSVCVTGLTTVVTATHWSLFGKVVILILIQLGGLGVVCCMVAVLMLFRVKIDMREKVMIQESYGLDSMRKIMGIIPKVIKGTIIVELTGAIFYSFRFIPQYGFLRGVWYSVFHSISAFCNAGIDILGDNSLMDYSGDVLVNFTTMFLIIAGGIGLIVWWDVFSAIKKARKIGKFRGQIFCKLTLHSKIAISTTVFLIVSGSVLIFIFEYNNPDTIGNFGLLKKIIASLFQSVTTRTAGFAGVSQAGFRLYTYVVILVLMIIGGSPMGTAGGLKTTTVAMMFICVGSVIRGKKDVEVYNRRISSENIRTGLTVIVLGIAMLLAGIIGLSITDGFSGMATAYECTSAIATVGLSTGITPLLSIGGKLIIIIMMFIGRIGPITIAMAIGGKKCNNNDTRKLAEKKIIVG